MTPGLNREQRRTIRQVVRVGRRRGAPRKHIKAAIETIGVEANYTNPSGGEGTSAGAFQEIDIWGSVAKRTNVRGAASRFYDKAKKADRGQPSFELAQDVQRSAFPGRYQTKAAEAGQILRHFDQRQGRSRERGTTGGGTTPQAAAGVDRSADRMALAAAYYRQRGRPGALLELSAGLKEAQDVPGMPLHNDPAQPRSEAGRDHAERTISRFVSRANRVDVRAPRYQWGGGHGAAPAKLGTPVDCSGAVAQILRVKPRHSSRYGEVLAKGKGRVNVYYNDHHVFMEIDGKFYGTSGSNPGGGAGWIPRSKMSKEYLRGFKVGHVPVRGRKR